MVGIIATLLVIWLLLTILGFVIKGVFWLAVVGGLLFIATAAYGAIKGRSRT
ncbi:MAG TPA: hypothetical protein VGP03_11015 [Pseudonocardiaceae bacterium]|nr:hypothetical protein [Pseudonocardiaceae bacterium]